VSERLEMRSLLNSVSASILVDTPHQGVRLEFSSDVGSTLDASDVRLDNLTVDPSVSLDPSVALDTPIHHPDGSRHLTRTGANLLAEGNYEIAMSADSVSPALGQDVVKCDSTEAAKPSRTAPETAA
jgi:hypothetical protein